MKSWVSKGMLAGTILLPALNGVARADDFGCSNATLKGEYAFSGTNYIPPGLPQGPPNVFVGTQVIDGHGNFTQSTYGGDGRRKTSQTDFLTGATGTYTVNPDCTGS